MSRKLTTKLVILASLIFGSWFAATNLVRARQEPPRPRIVGRIAQPAPPGWGSQPAPVDDVPTKSIRLPNGLTQTLRLTPNGAFRKILAVSILPERGKLNALIDVAAWSGPAHKLAPDRHSVRLRANVFQASTSPSKPDDKGLLTSRVSKKVQIPVGELYLERIPFTLSVPPSKSPYIVYFTLEDPVGKVNRHNNNWATRRAEFTVP